MLTLNSLMVLELALDTGKANAATLYNSYVKRCSERHETPMSFAPFYIIVDALADRNFLTKEHLTKNSTVERTYSFSITEEGLKAMRARR